MEKIKELFFSFNGRISRKQFWLANLVLLIAYIILYFLLSPIFGLNPFNYDAMLGIGQGIEPPETEHVLKENYARSSLLILFIDFLLLIPAVAVYIKRRHDQGSHGQEIWFIFFLSLIISLIEINTIGYKVTQVGDWAFLETNLFIDIFLFMVSILIIYILFIAGFLKGDKGENEYGSDPLEK